MRLEMAEPGVNPVDNPRPRPTGPRFSLFFWCSCIGFVILIVWGVVIRPMTAKAAQPDQPEATPTAALSPTGTLTAGSPTPTGTIPADCPPSEPVIIDRQVTRLAPVRETQIVEVTREVPGEPVIIDRQITQIVQVTVWATQIITSTPEPTQTPWVIVVEVTREVTVTPTPSPTATLEPTGTMEPSPTVESTATLEISPTMEPSATETQTPTP